ncbi:MAG TPA: hypothetical protein DCO77_13760 [Nitrospiraceae bacterium]|nr:hypothetical protein [Nitrospiraceae bacterium]
MPEKKPLLVICHTQACQMYIGVLLNRIWYAPILAKNADEGIFIAKKSSPLSLVILDSDLPEDTFRSALTLLRTDDTVKSLPLVVITTRNDKNSREALLSQGCAAVLTKPLDVSLIFGVLARLTKQPRIHPRAPARIEVEIDDGKTRTVLPCVNISEGGLYLRTHIPLLEETVLNVKFRLPHGTEELEIIAEVTAEVVRTSPLESRLSAEPGMALRFLTISEEIKEQIRNFVQWEMAGDLEWEPEPSAL